MIKKKRLAPTPRMRRGTYSAYQVLEWVVKQLKAEPKRLYMGAWLALFKGMEREATRDYLITIRGRRGIPECGTVACLAGWINIGTRAYEQRHDFVGHHALENLGFTRVFTRVRNEWDQPAANKLMRLFLQTHLDSTDVIEQVKEIMRNHEADLKNRQVVVS